MIIANTHKTVQNKAKIALIAATYIGKNNIVNIID